MRFEVTVQLRKFMAGGRPTHEVLKQRNWTFDGPSAPGKMESKTRRDFNAAEHRHGKHTLVCVSTSVTMTGDDSAAITVVAETAADIAAREEAHRLAAGGAPKRSTPRSRHH